MCNILRISCLAIPSSSHAFANFSLSFSALLLITCPLSLRHRSIVCLISIPTASRVPSATNPFLARGLRPFPVLTWKSSKATLRFSVRCAAAAGWSTEKGQQILRNVNAKMSYKSRGKAYNGMPLPRDSITLLKPLWETNHPVACRSILL